MEPFSMAMSEALFWFDTHAHLSDPKFDEDRETVIKNAFDKNVSFIVEIADGPPEWEKARDLTKKFKSRMRFAAGLHPYFSDQGSNENWSRLEAILKDPLCVALGEVGLDYAKCPIPKDVQIQTFKKAIDLAKNLNLPLVIHCREAYEDLVPILEEKFSLTDSHPNPPGVIHCFSGTKEDVSAILPFGFFFGIDGPITYPSATPLREALKAIPPDRLVLETDSPYLPPQGFRGQRNDPSLLAHVGERIAQEMGINPEKLNFFSRQNSEILFKLKLP